MKMSFQRVFTEIGDLYHVLSFEHLKVFVYLRYIYVCVFYSPNDVLKDVFNLEARS